MRKHAGTSAWARLVLAAGFVFCCAGTVAQATDPGEADAAFISLIAEAVRRQPELGTRQSSVAEARGSLSEAQAAFFPRVQLLVDSGEDRNVRGSDITRSRERGEINPQLALTQLLYDGGAAWGQLRAARERVDAASREIDGAANSLALQAVQIYFTVLRQREAVKIAEENLRRVRSVRDKVAGRADAGRDPRSELLRLGSRVLEARSQLTDAQRNLEDANAAFEEFFGYAPGELHVPRTYPMRRQSVEEALAYAREHSPELLALRSELEASAADADSARASMLWPRLSLEASGTAYDAFGGGGVENRDTYIGLRVSYDVFSGGASVGRVRQATSRRQAARFALERAERTLERRLRQAYAALEARESQLAAVADRMNRDRDAIEDYEELFLAGRRTLNDLIVAQRDYFASATLFLDVQLDLNVQRYSVPALTGELAEYFGIGQSAAFEGGAS